MADITKCSGESCKRKQFCERYTAEASILMQSEFVTSPAKLRKLYDENVCAAFWRNER